MNQVSKHSNILILTVVLKQAVISGGVSSELISAAVKMVFVKEENTSEPEPCRIKHKEPEPCRIKHEEPETWRIKHEEPETWRIKQEETKTWRIKQEEQGGWCLFFIRISSFICHIHDYTEIVQSINQQ